MSLLLNLKNKVRIVLLNIEFEKTDCVFPLFNTSVCGRLFTIILDHNVHGVGCTNIDKKYKNISIIYIYTTHK